MADRLQSPVRHDRLAAVVALGSLPPAVGLPYAGLVALRLDDADVRIQIAAATALGKLGPCAGQHAGAVAAKLSEPSATVRQAAAQALGLLRAVCAAAQLAACLGDADGRVRKEAEGALVLLGPTAAAEAVASKLKSSDGAVRSVAQKTLVAMRDGEGEQIANMNVIISFVKPVLVDPDPDIRRSASEALVRLGATECDRPLAAECSAARLQDRRDVVRLAAAQELGALGAYATPHALALAECVGDESEEVRSTAATALNTLGVRGASAVPVLKDLLRNNRKEVRYMASKSMNTLGPEADVHVVERSVALLGDDSAAVRCRAVEALADLGEEGLVEAGQMAKVAALKIDPFWYVRRAVATAFAKFGNVAVQEHNRDLDVLILDSDWRVRQAANSARQTLSTMFHSSERSRTPGG